METKNKLTPEKIGEIALIFLAVRDQLKIYHWQTNTYARHIAADTFVTNLTVKMDTFMETLQGTYNMKLKLNQHGSILFKDESDLTIISVLKKFKEWLEYKLNLYLNSSGNTDLLNIRDDILGEVNKTIYLFTLA